MTKCDVLKTPGAGRHPVATRRIAFVAAVSAALLAGAAAAQQQPPLLTPEKLRPVAHAIVDCPVPPVALPEEVARWATIYCTEHDGQLFAYRDGYYGIFPGSVKRFIVNASGFGGGEDAPPVGQAFAGATFEPFNKDELERYAPGKSVPAFLGLAKSLYLLTLKIDNGQETQMLVADPQNDPFWVQPLRGHRFSGQAFYMASLDFLNKAQQQQ